VGIGETTPVINYAFFDFVSPRSLSYLWVSGRRRLLVFGLVTPVTSRAVVALYVLPGDASGITFNSTLTLTFALVNA